MRYFISLLFLTLLYQANSQVRLEGKYCLDDERAIVETVCINFHKEGSFEYEKSDSIGLTYGNGTYKIKKRNLFLNFNFSNLNENNKSIIIKKEIEKPKNEEAKVFIKLIDLIDSTEIFLANLSIIDTIFNDQHINGAYTNTSGIASLIVKKGNLLRVSMVLYKKLEIPISNKKHTEITIYLEKSNYRNYLGLISNLSYRINKIKDNQFLLKKQKEKRFRKYVLK